MATTYLNRIRITLEPVYHSDPPEVRVGIDDHLDSAVLENTTTFDLDFDATADRYHINVDFVNKNEHDTIIDQRLDKAVIVRSIEIFGTTDPRFVYAGVYRPVYPEPWFSQQNPPPEAELKGADYLGWNGRWSLEFSVPIFTWMHQTQNLGWIYT